MRKCLFPRSSIIIFDSKNLSLVGDQTRGSQRNIAYGQPPYVAQWIHLHLPSCGHMFKSQARFYQFIKELQCERTENRQQEVRFAYFLN